MDLNHAVPLAGGAPQLSCTEQDYGEDLPPDA